jgi:HEPN domain-containing protein
MKRNTEEWVAKAEADFKAAVALRDLEPEPMLDAACFHAQQCAEKYLKAYLVEDGVRFRRVHDLEHLFELVLQAHPEIDDLRSELDDLTSLGMESRYPGTWVLAEDADRAIALATTVRDIVRRALAPD